MIVDATSKKIDKELESGPQVGPMNKTDLAVERLPQKLKSLVWEIEGLAVGFIAMDDLRAFAVPTHDPDGFWPERDIEQCIDALVSDGFCHRINDGEFITDRARGKSVKERVRDELSVNGTRISDEFLCKLLHAEGAKTELAVKRYARQIRQSGELPWAAKPIEDSEADSFDKPKRRRCPEPHIMLADDLEVMHPPVMAEPIIEGLLRRGETMNIIGSTKEGKSWLSLVIATSVANGAPLLGMETRKTKTLIIDNELRPATIQNRILDVSSALKLNRSGIELDCLRGRVVDLLKMNDYFHELKGGGYGLIVMDALYRFLPAKVDENSNGDMTQLYNFLDRWASELDCAFAIVHHSSKGDQSGKSVTDTGSGAGAISRAADSHFILRDHRDEGLSVAQAKSRSFPPMEPMTVRFEWPLWHRVEETTAVVGDRQSRAQSARDDQGKQAILDALSEQPNSARGLVSAGVVSDGRVRRLIHQLLDDGLIQIARTDRRGGHDVEIYTEVPHDLF